MLPESALGNVFLPRIVAVARNGAPTVTNARKSAVPVPAAIMSVLPVKYVKKAVAPPKRKKQEHAAYALRTAVRSAAMVCANGPKAPTRPKRIIVRKIVRVDLLMEAERDQIPETMTQPMAPMLLMVQTV